jgi:hypothetical protein
VIAFGAGGALDTIIPSVTGECFAEQTCASLLATLKRFDPQAYDPVACRTQAEGFSAEHFQRRLLDYLAQVTNNQL